MGENHQNNNQEEIQSHGLIDKAVNKLISMIEDGELKIIVQDPSFGEHHAVFIEYKGKLIKSQQ